MLDILDILTWSLHFSFLILLIFLMKDRTIFEKTAVVIYIFYSVAVLIPFQSQHFNFHFENKINSLYLASYIATDIYILSAVIYSRKVRLENFFCRSEERFGDKVLILLAIFAFFNAIFHDWNLFFLNKTAYISSEKAHNLFFISIPAEAILIGAAINSPFKNKYLNIIVFSLAFLAFFFSLFLGSRHYLLILVVILIIYFLKTKFAIPGLIFFFTAFGDISNFLKYLIGDPFRKNSFDLREYIESWILYYKDTVLISAEQRAILANLIKGSENLNYWEPLRELQNFLPGINRIMGPITENSAYKLSVLFGIDPSTGAGTAYSLQLFLLETFFLGGFILFLVYLIVCFFQKSILSVLSLEVFFSLQRNPPEYWSGQIKMLFILYFCIRFSDFFSRKLMKK